MLREELHHPVSINPPTSQPALAQERGSFPQRWYFLPPAHPPDPFIAIESRTAQGHLQADASLLQGHRTASHNRTIGKGRVLVTRAAKMGGRDEK